MGLVWVAWAIYYSVHLNSILASDKLNSYNEWIEERSTKIFVNVEMQVFVWKMVDTYIFEIAIHVFEEVPMDKI